MRAKIFNEMQRRVVQIPLPRKAMIRENCRPTFIKDGHSPRCRVFNARSPCRADDELVAARKTLEIAHLGSPLSLRRAAAFVTSGAACKSASMRHLIISMGQRQ